MYAEAKLKVPNGKLVSARLLIEEQIIKHATITGDFFMHPENCIDNIEQVLVGLPVTTTEHQFSKLIEAVALSDRAELVGVTPDSIAKVIRQALDGQGDG